MRINLSPGVLLFVMALHLTGCANDKGSSAASTAPSTAPATQPAMMMPAIPLSDARFTVGKLLYADEFATDSGLWEQELEHAGNVAIGDGKLEIDVPAGATVWFKPVLSGPILIEYKAKMISAGGANDRVSDLNCFWMASDATAKEGNRIKHTGAFASYNTMKLYYVGQGGNTNTTTRFRRYIGDAVDRPLLPENDLRDAANLLVANKTQLIQLVACGNLIQYYRDGHRVFELNDPEPYTSGSFGIRTTKNHMVVSSFRVFELSPTKK